MTTLRRVSLSALCASSCLLAACRGDFVLEPATITQTVPQNTRLAFTADHAWTLTSVKFDNNPTEFKDRFNAQSGSGGDRQQADIFLEAGHHTAFVTLAVVRYGGESGGPDAVTHQVEFNTPKTLNLSVNLPASHEDPPLFQKPITVEVMPNFAFTGLEVSSESADSVTPRDWSAQLLSRSGGVGQRETVEMALFAPRNYRIKAKAIDSTGAPITSSPNDVIAHFVKANRPLCRSPSECLLPLADTLVYVDSTLGAACGGGTWGYLADSNQGRCEQVGRAPPPPFGADWVRVPVKDTECVAPDERLFVDGNVACVTERGSGTP